MPFQISTSASLGPCRPTSSGSDGTREDQVAAGAPDDAVAVAGDDRRVALCVRRAQRDVDAGFRPQPGDRGGVHL